MSRSSLRSLSVAALVALAVLAVAGCGGDTRRAEDLRSTSAQPVPAPRPTRQLSVTPASAKVTDPARRTYVTRADGVCSRLDRERNTARERAARSVDTREAAKAYEDTIALGKKQLRQIEAIPTPPMDAKLLRTNVFDVLRRQLAVRRRMGSALASANVPELKALRAELDSLTQSLVGFARGYGFQVCGED